MAINCWAWAARLPHVYRFLLDVREEPNPLRTPELEPTLAAGEMAFPVFAGTAYAVERAATLTNAWLAVSCWMGRPTIST